MWKLSGTTTQNLKISELDDRSGCWHWDVFQSQFVSTSDSFLGGWMLGERNADIVKQEGEERGRRTIFCHC